MLTIAVLGLVEVRRGGVRAAVPSGLTTELLVRLALDAGRPVRAERLVADLWPTGTRLNTLQAKVSQLRRALGDPEVLTAGPAGYTLAIDPEQVDAVRVLRFADECAVLLAAGDAGAAAERSRSGLALFGPEALPAAGSAEWVVPHRVRLEEARLRLVADGLAARLQLGATGEVIGELESLVARHPLQEGLWALLITALYRAGRQSDALAAHRRVTRLLADELGVDPGPQLRALELRVLAQDPALDRAAERPAATAPAIVASAARPGRAGNAAALDARLVGRADDLAGVRARLDAHRLVTLVGPAGVGKTRLATEVARLTDDPHGGWLVRLEGVRSGAELSLALADTIPGVDDVEDLRGAQLLLVLDNCEHLAEAVAAFAARVLDTAPQVRLLATSQRPLGLDGEVVQVLAPLPDADAVALFAQRAAERAPSFALTAETAADVSRLCRALDGLPLAIELAAARTRILSVAEISRRLDDRFVLLADPTSTAPERRRTLAAALSWSYDLLFPDDQRGLWALAQFPGGATMPAVEHVLAALGVPGASALDVVERLADRSLVTVDAGAGGTRYRLLDSIRAFAEARAAAAGAADTAADAVLGWVAELAETVAAHVRGPDQAVHVAVTGAERATIDAALDRARTHDPVTGLRIAVGFGWAWILLDDGAAAGRLRAAHAAAPHAPPDLRVTALLLEAWLESMSNDLRPARTAFDAAISAAGDDPALVALTQWYGGFVLFQEGRPAEALDGLDRCRASFAASGASWWEGGSLLLAAFAHLTLGDIAAGRAACEQAIRIITPLGDGWGLLHAEAALGRVAQAEGRFPDAARHHGQAAASAAQLGFGGAAALHLAHLGRAQLDGGDPAAAATLDRAIAGAERAGDLRLLAMARVARAEAHLAAGDRTGARDLLTAAHRWYTAAGAGDGAQYAADLLAQVAGAAPLVTGPENPTRRMSRDLDRSGSRSVQGGPVGELLDVAVERPVLE